MNLINACKNVNLSKTNVTCKFNNKFAFKITYFFKNMVITKHTAIKKGNRILLFDFCESKCVLNGTVTV